MGEAASVMVVGAGPVGLVFASEMARHGVACRVVDRAQGTKEISKALILHVRTQEVLDAMGITHEAQDAALPMRRVEIIGYGKHLGHGEMEGIDSPHPYPIILGQNVTEHILHEHLAKQGVSVEWNTEAVNVEQDAEGVTVTLKHADGREELVRSQFVLGADGTHSVVRLKAGIDFQGNRYNGQAFIQSDSKIRWSLPGGVSYLWFTEKGYMMVIEMPNGIVRTFISVPDPGPDVKKTTLEEVNEALNQMGGVDAELYDAVWVALYRVNHRAAPFFRKERIFIAGDAAHEHVPIGGQGMNTSIQDAFNLAWKLAYAINGKAPANILDSYQAERHPVAESLLSGTDEAYTTLLKAGELGRAAVRLLGPFLLASETVRRKMRHTLEEIDINYRKGPMSADHGGSEGPEAGDRVLDSTVVTMPSRESKPLREILRGTHWTLLIFLGRHGGAGHEYEPASIGRRVNVRFPETVKCFLVVGGFPIASPGGDEAAILLDPMNHAHDHFGVQEACMYLVRPDMYVGFRGKLTDSPALMEYLDRVLVSAECTGNGA
jgi:2-polyprenyl-6-methoxyphenol hydroxylase-like FAD-dependent oxidoreductase